MASVRTLCVMIGVTTATVIAAHAQVLQEHGTDTAAHQSFSAQATESMRVMHHGMQAGAGPGTSDEVFVRMMIPHHEGAVAMARAILLYGTDGEVQRLAKAMVVEQQYEIDRMRLWLERYGARESDVTSPAPLEVSR